jgi:AcrR family transcriptional regulator
VPRSKNARPRTLLDPEDRRRQLLDAAIAVFAAKGYRQAGVADIIAAAGVARGTFYLYFESKERVFLAIVEEFHGKVSRAFEQMDDAAIGAISGGAQAVLAASFRQWLTFFAEHRDVTRVILREARAIDSRFDQGYRDLRKAAVTRFTTRFKRFQDLGFARADISAELAAHFQLGMFDELLNAFVLGDEPADIDAIANALASFEWNGIKPQQQL